MNIWQEHTSILSNLHEKFQKLIGYLIYEKDWLWLHLLISTLATFEMEVKMLWDKEFKYNYIDRANIKRISGPDITEPDKEYPYEQIIPKNTMYCECCEYWDGSKVARFFLGSQCDGYCYYLGKGDFSFINSTDLLWDGCKCCEHATIEDI